MYKLIAVTFLLLCSAVSVAAVPQSFYKAKKLVPYVRTASASTYMCGCSYTADRVIQQDTCGYVPRTQYTASGKENIQDNRVEIDHVVPASLLGSGLICWGTQRGYSKACYTSSGNLLSGRECCLRTNPVYRKAHNDLINLGAVVGEVNADKGNYMVGTVPGDVRDYGIYEIEIADRIWEPPSRLQGDVARIHLYMLKTYGSALGFSYTDAVLRMFSLWTASDPVAPDEIIRNKSICILQGSGNTAVSKCN